MNPKSEQIQCHNMGQGYLASFRIDLHWQVVNFSHRKVFPQPFHPVKLSVAGLAIYKSRTRFNERVLLSKRRGLIKPQNCQLKESLVKQIRCERAIIGKGFTDFSYAKRSPIHVSGKQMGLKWKSTKRDFDIALTRLKRSG